VRVQREQENRERAESASGDMPEKEDGILLVPEGGAGVCVRVQNGRRRRVAVARGSEGWGALDEDLSDGEWELTSHVPRIRFAGSKGFKAAPAIIPPKICPPTISLGALGED